MKLIKLAFVFALLLTQTRVLAEPEPYLSVHSLSYKPFFLEDGFLLFDLINRQEANVFIDIGSIEGGAARYIGENRREGLKIYSINDWLNPDPNAKFQFQKFLSNVKQEQTTDFIIPIRMNSQEAANALNASAEVIYINATNEADIYNDILVWSTHLTTNGVICGNNWLDTSVQKGVTSAAAALDLSLSANNNFWVLERGQ